MHGLSGKGQLKDKYKSKSTKHMVYMRTNSGAQRKLCVYGCIGNLQDHNTLVDGFHCNEKCFRRDRHGFSAQHKHQLYASGGKWTGLDSGSHLNLKDFCSGPQQNNQKGPQALGWTRYAQSPVLRFSREQFTWTALRRNDCSLINLSLDGIKVNTHYRIFCTKYSQYDVITVC